MNAKIKTSLIEYMSTIFLRVLFTIFETARAFSEIRYTTGSKIVITLHMYKKPAGRFM